MQKHNTDTPIINYKHIHSLYKHSINDLMCAHAKATAYVLQKKSPVRILEFEHIDISSMGQLMITGFIDIIVIAKLIDINPFDQPAVEESKRLAIKFLANTDKNC